jgi:hypothetical protein
MFDTFTIRHPVKNPCLDAFTDKGGKYVLNRPPVRGYSLPQLTYSDAPDGLSYLGVTVSLPKFYYGNNVQMISESDLALAMPAISIDVSDVVGVKFDSWTAKVGRLDFCNNFPVSEKLVPAYLHALRDASYPRMVRNAFEDGTVNFTNTAGTRPARPSLTERVTVYSKHAEVLAQVRAGRASDADLQAAVGILRVEHRYMTGSRVRRLAAGLRLPDRTAESLLRARVWETIMGETISKLGLDRHIESGDSRLDLVRERFGVGPAYQRLAGFIALLDKHGAAGLFALGYNKETFRRYQKMLDKAGVSITNPTRTTLPPLRLVRGGRAAAAAGSSAKG